MSGGEPRWWRGWRGCAGVGAAVLALSLAGSGAFAADVPRSPCDGAPNPAYAGADRDPAVRIWSGGKTGVKVDSACTPGVAGSFRLVVALSGSFRGPADAAGLLARLGAVSRMQGVRYWSASRQRWSDLITRASARDGPRGAARADFSAAEMKPGQDLYFAQGDTGSTGQVEYRMRIVKAEKDRIVVEVDNTTPLKFIVTLFEPGELRTAYFLTRGAGDVWNFYMLTAVDGAKAEGHKASIVNRAAALYRHVAGQQTDREPPLAPAG